MSVILSELRDIADAVDPAELQALTEALIAAKRVFFSGQGRSGLMVRAIAIRLMHIGLTVYVAGETSAPSIGQGDLLVAVSASAKTQATLTHMDVARRTGAKVALVSAVAVNPGLSDILVTIPARTAVATLQHAGSLFEQSLLLIGDAIAWQVQRSLRVEDRELDERHANLQ
ncbi:6-phospho 3-hexuloisomerase [Gordoniibacillus kamchatkensis]|uniref:6-phospho 3-hexuloisomerase n=1 Tax=Gordoniibacillus kamchatkensis TaxID=1590651 RepID=A0ABR5AG68_9BACL|nr:6-phospho 3-hexuloisomerase [Paenibacillus sp. VKM B-2647]